MPATGSMRGGPGGAHRGHHGAGPAAGGHVGLRAPRPARPAAAHGPRRWGGGGGCSRPNPASSAAFSTELWAMLRGVDDERRGLGLEPAAVLAEAGGALAGAEEGHQGGGAGGVLDHAGEAVGQPDQLAEPLHRHLLQLGGGGAGLPAHALRAEAGGDQVGQHRGQVAVGGEVGEEPRVVPVGDAGEDGPVEHGKDLAEGDAVLRRSARGTARRTSPGSTGHITGKSGQPLAVGGDPLDELVAQGAELVGCHRSTDATPLLLAPPSPDGSPAGGGGLSMSGSNQDRVGSCSFIDVLEEAVLSRRPVAVELRDGSAFIDLVTDVTTEVGAGLRRVPEPPPASRCSTSAPRPAPSPPNAEPGRAAPCGVGHLRCRGNCSDPGPLC